MESDSRTKQQLLQELTLLRNRVAEMEGAKSRPAIDPQSSELLSSVLFDSIDDSVTVQDVDYNVIRTNKAVERAFGGDVVGKKCYRAYQGRDSICPDCPTQKVWDQGQGSFSAQQTGVEGTVYEIRAFPIRDAGGKIIAVLEQGRDISERTRTEEAVRNNEKKFHAIIDASPVPYALNDEHQDITYLNPAFVKTFGYDLKDIPTLSDWWPRAYPDAEYRKWVATNWQDQLEKAKQSGTPFEPLELDIRCKDGRTRRAIVGAAPLGKTFDGVHLVSLYDITERKQAEEALRAKTEELDRYFDQALDLLCIADTDGYFRRVNKAWEITLGYKTGDLEGHRFLDFVHPDDLDPTLAAVSRLASQSEVLNFTNRYRRKDGSYRWIEWASHPEGKLIYAVARDITERKQAEEALRESQERYHALFDRAPTAIVRTRIDGSAIIEANQKLCEVSGYSKEELLRKPVTVFWARPEQRSDMIELLKKNGHIEDYEFDLIDKGGGIRNCLASFKAYPEKGYLEGTIVDMTKRKQAEEEVKRSKELLRAVFDGVGDSICTIDVHNHTIVSANAAFLAQECMTIDQVRGKTCHELTHRLPEPCGMPNDPCPLVAMRSSWNTEYVEHTHFVQGGGTKIFEVAVSPIRNLDGSVTHAIHVSRDISARKQMQEQQQRMAKLESIGTLAGGIAHDFNNMLTGILGNIQLAGGYLEQNKYETVKKMLEEAEKASLRAAGLTQQLLTFSRGGAPVKKLMSVNALISESATFSLRGSKVNPVFSLPDDLWQVEVDPGQLNQVIGNLVINADQAMPLGGRIDVSARNMVAGTDQVLLVPEGNYVEIVVKDHGIGIPESHSGRIFEPYFTTKDKGHGLGLATSFSIVKNHGGTLTFDSTLGVGTTFRVYLPASVAKVKAEPSTAKAATESSPTAHGRILVMDDDESIRSLLNALLNGAGYSVEVASDGAEAVRKYAEATKSGKPFDAVIMDLTIPGGMGGKEAIKELLKIDPKVKALVSSGYANDPILMDFSQHGFKGIVTKPYSVREMVNTMQKVLAEQA